jgi:hypothetical protein
MAIVKTAGGRRKMTADRFESIGAQSALRSLNHEPQQWRMM